MKLLVNRQQFDWLLAAYAKKINDEAAALREMDTFFAVADPIPAGAFPQECKA